MIEKIYDLIKAEDLVSEAEPITEADLPTLVPIINRMKEIVRSRNGIGLAGPQIGFNKQIFVVRAPGEEDSWDVCFNPEITPNRVRGKASGEEGCLSFLGKLFRVFRWKSLSVKWMSPVYNKKADVVIALKEMKNKLDDSWARIAQHEVDHLHGRTVDIVGELIDQRKQLIEIAAKAGLVFDEEKGLLLAEDPKTGVMVPVDPALALDMARKARKKEKKAMAEKEAWEQRDAAKKKREQKRKRQRDDRKKNRRGR